ncbi:MAG: hypothetical protein ACXVZP_05285 [Gaiellaceae bacterium]
MTQTIAATLRRASGRRRPVAPGEQQPAAARPRRAGAALRSLLVALLVVAAAAAATFANVSLLGNAERSSDPIGRLTPRSYPSQTSRRAGVPKVRPARSAPGRVAAAAGAVQPRPTAPAGASAGGERRRQEHGRRGSRADD